MMRPASSAYNACPSEDRARGDHDAVRGSLGTEKPAAKRASF